MSLREQIVTAYRSAQNDEERRIILAEIANAIDDVWGVSTLARDWDIAPEHDRELRGLTTQLRVALDDIVLRRDPWIVGLGYCPVLVETAARIAMRLGIALEACRKKTSKEPGR
jgi:hypothetical protein